MADSQHDSWEFPKTITRERMESYYASLGRFVHMFGQTEEALNAMLKLFVERVLGVPDPCKVLDALTGGMRIALLRDNIKRLMRITNMSAEAATEINGVFGQLGEIHYFRDRIVHNGAEPVPDQGENFFLTTNVITVREHDEHDSIWFKPSDLVAMASDLDLIQERLWYVLNPPSEQELRNDPALGDYIRSLQRPWRYKPSQLRRTGPKHDPTLRRRGLPPEPSQV